MSLPCSLRFLPSIRRAYSTTGCDQPIICIPPGSRVYAFGSASQSGTPLIQDFDWTVQDGEAWVVISGTGREKTNIFKTLLGHTRISTAAGSRRQWVENGGLYPFFSKRSVDPYTKISHVSFRQRSGGVSGSFFDYTARYGASWDTEDRTTLREMLDITADKRSSKKYTLVDQLIENMNLLSLLDLPVLSLSNGQTRRARIVKAILSQPELLLLDEPLTGLDPPSRTSLNEVLRNLHRRSAPRVLLGLRRGEVIPDWITHVLEVQGVTSSKRLNSPSAQSRHRSDRKRDIHILKKNFSRTGELVADLRGVNVSYGDRRILNDVNWQIRQGERWHLRGANGSGKTTLLALLTGDHPQSFVQDHLRLPSASCASSSSAQSPPLLPRSKIPIAHLRRLIGSVSPEMFDAFPRRHPGMSVWEAITTGFDGGFVPRTREADVPSRHVGAIGWVDVSDEEIDIPTPDGQDAVKKKRREDMRRWRIDRCWEVLEYLGPASWKHTTLKPENPISLPSETTRAFASLAFSSISPGEQRLVLLMRALVGRPPLVLLDEPWSGMDDTMIAASRRYLRGETHAQDSGVNDTQAVVVVTHWEDEVPWAGNEVQLFDLRNDKQMYFPRPVANKAGPASME